MLGLGLGPLLTLRCSWLRVRVRVSVSVRVGVGVGVSVRVGVRVSVSVSVSVRVTYGRRFLVLIASASSALTPPSLDVDHGIPNGVCAYVV